MKREVLSGFPAKAVTRSSYRPCAGLFLVLAGSILSELEHGDVPQNHLGKAAAAEESVNER